MQYDKEFEEIWGYIDQKRSAKDIGQTLWNEARKDHYRIGEEVQIDCRSGGQDWELGIVGAITAKIGSGFVDKPLRVRRWPAFEPKAGEAVFAMDATGKVWVAKVQTLDCDGIYIICSDGDVSMWNSERIKPFSAEKIGKPWEEI